MAFAAFEVKSDYETWGFYAEDNAAGVARLSPEQFAEQVARVRAERPNAIVVAYPHWGSNYRWRSRSQRDAGRALIDAGADLVIGHHAHTLQEADRYKGRWIFFGIGNFVFNAPGRFADNPEVLPYGLAIELELHPEGLAQTLVRAFPIFSDNRRTAYRPRLAASAEADQVFARWLTESELTDHRLVRRADDAVGPALEFRMR